jgi:sarcosine oxidase subunit beta
VLDAGSVIASGRPDDVASEPPWSMPISGRAEETPAGAPPLPLWSDPVAIRYRTQPPKTAELVIVGGGIVGAATAFHAARAGLRPVILEGRSSLASLTTAAAAGGYRLQLDDEEEFRLISESVELFTHFADATGQRDYDAGVRPQGYLWATTTEAGARRQDELVEAQRRWGLTDVDVMAGADARREFPFLSDEVVQTRFRRGDGLLDPKGVTFGLVAGSQAEVVTRCSVTGFRVRGNRLAAVETGLGSIETDEAVIAAGPLSGLVADLAGVTLPVTAVRRNKLVLPEVGEVPPSGPMTVDDDTGAHWRPAFGGAYLLFTDPSTPPSDPAEDVPPDPEFAFQVFDPASPVSVARITPFWREVWERGSAHWMLQAGQYTMTPDRRPLLGHTPIEGLLVNTGYSGRGVMAGPAGSRHLVDVLTGKVRADDNPFRPDRAFADRPQLDPL